MINKKNQLIWEGIATQTIDENPQTRDKNIPKSIAMIMAQYPLSPMEEKK